MSAKSRMQLLKKIEKSAQTDEITQETPTSTQDEKAAWNLFDQIWDQVFAEEVSKLE
jgi:hypothetical protein